jgi:uncharacterized protein (DUF1501 family)
MMPNTRRDFLRAAVGTTTLLSLGRDLPGLLTRAAAAAVLPQSGQRDTVLVVIQLSGGNDGLNTVVPYADDEYGRHRSTLRLPDADLHKIDSHLAFHPRMAAFLRLYKEGHLAVLQGVGYPHSDRSHDRAMRIWHTANPEHATCQTGWLGRVADQVWSPAYVDTAAVFAGSIDRPFGLNAERAVIPTIRSCQDLILRQMPADPFQVPQTGNDSPTRAALKDLVRQATVDARVKAGRVAAASEAGPAAAYPACPLAADLRTVARLIRADVGIRIFFAEMGGGGIGGFDNHANQLGNHCALLGQLAESMAAFIDDLGRDRLVDRVLVMTFSEFGRTLTENGRRGTDHGAAGPVFLAGGRLKGGLVGEHPSLTDLDQDALKFNVDFRRVYATVLDRWLGIDSQAILGRPFDALDILKA